jgi:YVTN family beta-propeller protein
MNVRKTLLSTLVLLLASTGFAAVEEPRVVATVDLPEAAGAVAVNPLTNRVYATHRLLEELSVIDGNTDTVIARVPLGGGPPRAVVVHPLLNRIYVTTRNLLWMIDGETNAVISLASPGFDLVSPTIDVLADRLYVPAMQSKTVAVVDASSNEVLHRVSTGRDPRASGLDPLRGKLFVPLFRDARVSVLDTETSGFVAHTSVGTGPVHTAVNPSLGRVYVSQYQDRAVTVLDAGSHAVLTRIEVGPFPNGVTINPLTDRAYVRLFYGDGLPVIDGETDRVVADVDVGRIAGPAVNTLANRLYAANANWRRIYVIDGATDEILHVVPANRPREAVVNPFTGRIYSATADRLTVIEDPAPTSPLMLEAIEEVRREHGATNPEVVYRLDLATAVLTDADRGNDVVALRSVLDLLEDVSETGAAGADVLHRDLRRLVGTMVPHGANGGESQ